MSKRPIRSMRTLSSRQRRSKKRTVLARDGARCALCGSGPLEPEALILKRIVHLKLGGSSCLDNLHLICHRCNRNGRPRKAGSTQ